MKRQFYLASWRSLSLSPSRGRCIDHLVLRFSENKRECVNLWAHVTSISAFLLVSEKLLAIKQDVRRRDGKLIKANAE